MYIITTRPLRGCDVFLIKHFVEKGFQLGCLEAIDFYVHSLVDGEGVILEACLCRVLGEVDVTIATYATTEKEILASREFKGTLFDSMGNAFMIDKVTGIGEVTHRDGVTGFLYGAEIAFAFVIFEPIRDITVVITG